MKTLSSVIFLSTLLSAQVQAWTIVQKPGAVSRVFDPTDVGHGDPRFDPSPMASSHLALKKPVSQVRMALWGVTHRAHYDRSLSYAEALKVSPSYLGLHQKRLNVLEWTPSFTNTHYEFADISDRKFGYCWGFSTLNRYFTQIAFFDPKLPKDSMDVTRQKIEALMHGKPQVFAGFKNYREFSLVPEIEITLKLKSMELWANRAITKSSVSTFFSSTHVMKPDQVHTLLSKLQAKLASHELPKLMFTAKNSVKVLGGSSDIHVVLVTGVEFKKTGAAVIRLWDSNFYGEEFLKTPKFIEVRPVGETLELHFDPWYENKAGWTARQVYESTQLGQVKITPENDLETAMMIKGLDDFCWSHASYCQ